MVSLLDCLARENRLGTRSGGGGEAGLYYYSLWREKTGREPGVEGAERQDYMLEVGRGRDRR